MHTLYHCRRNTTTMASKCTSASTSTMVNHSGVCTPCHLCHKSNPKMKHPGQMKEHAQLKEVYEWLKLKKSTINETACICLPCVKQIQLNLDIVWEISENIAKSKASLNFFLDGCKCKTGCTTRIYSCGKNERSCGPSCSCHFCKNNPTPQRRRA